MVKQLNHQSICLQPHTIALCIYVHKDALIQTAFGVHFFSKPKINTKTSWQASKQSSLSSDPTPRHKDNIPKQQLLKRTGRKHSCHCNSEEKATITSSCSTQEMPKVLYKSSCNCEHLKLPQTKPDVNLTLNQT